MVEQGHDDSLDTVVEGAVRIGDAADILGVSVRTVRQWVAEDRIPYMRSGGVNGKILLFLPGQLLAYLRDEQARQMAEREALRQLANTRGRRGSKAQCFDVTPGPSVNGMRRVPLRLGSAGR